MFVQIHLLQSLPPGNLNRDDTGQPKKCLFGGVTRGRISSQCQKRNIRRTPQFQEYLGGGALRSRYLPKLVCDALALQGVDGFDDTEAAVLSGVLAKQFKSEKTGGEEGEASAAPKNEEKATKQVVFFTRAFVGKMVEDIASARNAKKVAKLTKGEKKDWYAGFFKTYRPEIARASEQLTPDIAMFGRMTTSDLLVDVEATCQVAHAISTHEAIIESDYFTAMDDLAVGPGAAYIGSSDTETSFFNAAVYYKYFNIDVDALRDEKHLTEAFSREDAAKLVGAFLEAAVRVNPTGKQNAFAAHGMPELILVELSGTKQPISYANAFLQAVEGENLMKESAVALDTYITSVAAAYAPADTRRYLMKVGSAKDVAFKVDADACTTLDALVEQVKTALTAEG
jgi:CRISPR system Cascade subunit CasC